MLFWEEGIAASPTPKLTLPAPITSDQNGLADDKAGAERNRHEAQREIIKLEPASVERHDMFVDMAMLVESQDCLGSPAWPPASLFQPQFPPRPMHVSLHRAK